MLVNIFKKIALYIIRILVFYARTRTYIGDKNKVKSPEYQGKSGRIEPKTAYNKEVFEPFQTIAKIEEKQGYQPYFVEFLTK